MATLVLSGLGSAVGASVGGGVLGVSSAMLGRAVGATVGRVIDQTLLGSGSAPVETGRLDRLRLTGAGEGAAMPRLHGRLRVAGHVIWASRFLETETTHGGGKGAGRAPAVTEYGYSVSLAVALGEGPISRVGRIWADGAEVEQDTLTMRVYDGDDAQLPDPKIAAVEGAANAPAYRGTAYVVFEDLDLSPYGNRVPQFSFEVIRTGGVGRDMADVVQGVAMIPGTGEYALATTPVRYEDGPGISRSANVNTPLGKTDFAVSVEALTQELPGCGSTALVVSWFGSDLRCGTCEIAPKVEQDATDGAQMAWRVSGVDRAAAGVVPRGAAGPVYGGTPADRAVIEAIEALREAGQHVMFYPFLLMEPLAGNGLTDPYGGGEQPALPWRGRITLSVAPGRDGSPDRSAAAAQEVAAFFGTAEREAFVPETDTIRYEGADGWSYRRFILHYAHLCAQVGGVDAFCIGSEMRGLTGIRGAADSFPAVTELRRLAADVRAILGPEVKIGYAADWSEYFGYQPQDGSGDLFYHLDPLWADEAIDFVGIDNYMPLSDWREGEDHADAAAGAIHDLDYLSGNVAGGEGYDWYYPTDAARAAQARTPITDGATLLIEREADETVPPGPFAGLGAGARGRTVTLSGSVRLPEAPVDAALLSTAGEGAGLWLGVRDGKVRLRAGALEAGTDVAVVEVPVAGLPFDGDVHRLTIEARPAAPGGVRLWVDGTLAGEAELAGALGGSVWSDGPAGGWLSGHVAVDDEPLGDWPAPEGGTLSLARGAVETVRPEEPWIFRYKDIRNWWSRPHHERIGGARRAKRTEWEPRSKPIWFTEFGCPAVDKGTNQPNVFFDPKSSVSALPHHSTGRRDDFLQLQYLRAVTGFWSDPSNNPVSDVYGGPMVPLERAHAWAWDARPYPWFPGTPELWADTANWTRGHWLPGRAGARALASVVEEACAAAGVGSVDVTRLWGLVRGYAVDEVTGGRNVLQPLMLAYGFDAVERDGLLRFQSRNGRVDAVLSGDDLAVTDELDGAVEQVRSAEVETGERVQIGYLGEGRDFAPAVSEAVLPGRAARMVARTDLPLVLTEGEATGAAERWLSETHVARDRVRLALPPSRTALGAGDVVGLEGERYRIDRVEMTEHALIEAQRIDPEVYRPRHAEEAPARVSRHVAAGPVRAVFLDLPLLTGNEAPHAPHVAMTARPWSGGAALYDSASGDGFGLNAVIERQAAVGVTETPLHRAASGVVDRGAPLRVRMWHGAPLSVPWERLLAWANGVAIGSGEDDLWEVFQFAEANVAGPDRYDLSLRLRGQLGTDGVMPEVWPAGSCVVLLDERLRQIRLAPAARGTRRVYRIGPSRHPLGHDSYVSVERTFAGVGLRPYAPVHLSAARDGDELVVRWVRRARVEGDSWDGLDVPLGEGRELYLVRALSDGAIVAEETVTAPLWRLASPSPGPLSIEVAQVSETYGSGPAARLTVPK